MGEETAAQTRGEKLWSTKGFGERMRIARQRAGMTLEDVGKALGVSGGAVSLWETNQNFPSRQRLDEFADLTRVEPTWLQFGVSASRLGPQQVARVPLRNPWALVEDSPKDSLITIEARFPCSPSAFAIEAFDGMMTVGGRHLQGDILIIDPEVKPAVGDMVLYINEDDGRPWVQFYWPPDSFSTFAAEFLDTVSKRIEGRNLRPPAYIAEIRNTIEQFISMIPNRAVIEYIEENPKGLFGGGLLREGLRFIGVVIEYAHGRESKVVHKNIT